MKGCGTVILKELIEEYRPFCQMFLQRVHFHTETLSLAVLFCAFQTLALFLSFGCWSKRLQFNFSLVTSAFKCTRKAKTENTTFPPNREVTK